MSAGSLLRVVRSGVFAVACVLLAGAGHALMSGTPVPGGTLVAACAGVGVGAWCLAGRERRQLHVAALALATQAALHYAFSAGQEHAATAGRPAPTPAPDGHGGAHALHSSGAMPGAGAMEHAHGSGAGMLAAHLLVALLSAWWLGCGERAAFRLVRAASARLFAPLVLAVRAVLPAPAPLVRADRGSTRRAPRAPFLSHVIWLRGPPCGPAV